MKDEFKYKSTPNGKPPSGAKQKGTFRDLTLSGLSSEQIDDIDAECIDKGITRWEWAMDLSNRDKEEFYNIFIQTNPSNKFHKWAKQIGKEHGFGEPEFSVHEEFTYKSSPDDTPPTGRRVSGTFRDLSLVRLKPEEIDIIDTQCIEQDITRRQWANNLAAEDPRKFYDIFSRTSEMGYVVNKIADKIKTGAEPITLDEPVYKTTKDGSPPTGYKTGGLQDLSLTRLEPLEIDEIDVQCQEGNISRRQWAIELATTDKQEFFRLFSKIDEYESLMEDSGISFDSEGIHLQ